jgi:hypothetical protein
MTKPRLKLVTPATVNRTVTLVDLVEVAMVREQWFVGFLV